MTMSDYIRERVAGAARSLWLVGGAAQSTLITSNGYEIVYAEAMMKLSGSKAFPVFMSMMALSQLYAQRRRTADAAEYLLTARGTTESWLWAASSGRINGAAETVRNTDKSLGRFREMSGGRTTDPMTGQRVYTLEDMQKAYLAAWNNSGEGHNGEHGPSTDSKSWIVERDEALRAL